MAKVRTSPPEVIFSEIALEIPTTHFCRTARSENLLYWVFSVSATTFVDVIMVPSAAVAGPVALSR